MNPSFMAFQKAMYTIMTGQAVITPKQRTVTIEDTEFPRSDMVQEMEKTTQIFGKSSKPTHAGVGTMYPK